MSNLIADFALVHGAGFETCGVASEYSLKQAELGAELLTADRVQAVVVCGKGPNATDSYEFTEAGLMKQHLVGLGINSDDIYTDELSANTLSNVIYGGMIAKQNGAESIIGVSRTTQKPRAVLAARNILPRSGLTYNGYRVVDEDVRATSVVREIAQISLLEMYLQIHRTEPLPELAEGYTAFIDKFFSKVKKARYSQGSARELSQ